MRKYFLWLLLASFAVLSLTTLRSIAPDLLTKQLAAFGLGACLFYGLSRLPFSFYLRHSKYAYWLINLLLLGLVVYGEAMRGTAGWISLPFGWNLQPSQFALPVTALYALSLWPKQQILNWRSLLQLTAVIGIPFVLIFISPDFGTAMVFVVALGALLWLHRLPWRYAVGLGAAALAAALLLWTVVFQDYQRDRVLGFLHLQSAAKLGVASTLEYAAAPTRTSEQSPAVYNARQALIAVGSGGVWGRGLGHGVQSHLRFLPERQTDFIFASFAEEWGLVGASILLSLYLGLLLFLLFISAQLPDFAAGAYVQILLVMLLVQTFINIGMNMSLLPITGITLPLMSYGGSSVLAVMMSLGVVQSLLGGLKKAPFYTFY